MADVPTSTAKPRSLESLIKLETVITIGAIIGAGLIGWGATQTNIAALAQRVEKGEQRDDETARTLSTVREAISELKTDAKGARNEQERQGRQLDRIEQLLRGLPPPSSRGTP